MGSQVCSVWCFRFTITRNEVLQGERMNGPNRHLLGSEFIRL